MDLDVPYLTIELERQFALSVPDSQAFGGTTRASEGLHLADSS